MSLTFRSVDRDSSLSYINNPDSTVDKLFKCFSHKNLKSCVGFLMLTDRLSIMQLELVLTISNVAIFFLIM